MLDQPWGDGAVNNPVHIVNDHDYRSLERYRRLWYAGWIAAGVSTLVTFWALGRVTAYRDAVVTLNGLFDQVDRVRSSQIEATAALAKNWEQQQQSIDVITEAAEQLRERRRQIDYNHNAIVDLTRSKK